jgi:Ca2+/Na+ antiporter
VITAIVASGSTEGVSYNIGSLFGAGLFVCAMVIYATITKSDTEIIVNRNTIYRDVGFYIAGSLLCLFFMFWGQIPWWGALSMLLMYGGLVIVTWIQDRGDEGDAANKIVSRPELQTN